jgi:hypothetical protein
MTRKTIWILVSLTFLVAGGFWLATQDFTGSAPAVPEEQGGAVIGTGPLGTGGSSPSEPVEELSWAPTMFADGLEPSPIEMSAVPAASEIPEGKAVARLKRDRRPELPISQEEADRLRREALEMPPSSRVQLLGESTPAQQGPGAVNFDGPDMSESCDGCATVPPDPEMAVGPDHIIVVVNVAFAIYDKSGNILPGYPKYFADFFSGVTGCTGEFDPNVLYDEQADRFVLGIDGGGTHYCVAASATGDPTGAWHRYSFQTGDALHFFDYPHAGVGLGAIYMGANIFGTSGFLEGRIWAIPRRRLYSGFPINVVSQSLGLDSTPQPMNLHGFNQGTWPLWTASQFHYFLTDDQFNGATYGVWSWQRPFNGSGGVLTKTGVVDLNAATGVTAGFPIDAPQQGGAAVQANDWRVQDAEYRNGSLWMTNTISCNPGSGVVNCVRWAEIDPRVPQVVTIGGVPNAGVFATDGEHRIFADAAANHCETVLLGYTKTSSTTNPGVSIAARRSSTAPGTLIGERDILTSSTVYSAFDTPPRRWGDYSGATSDPNGHDLWYVGEYSKDINFSLGNWGTYVTKLSTKCATLSSGP